MFVDLLHRLIFFVHFSLLHSNRDLFECKSRHVSTHSEADLVTESGK